MNAATAESTVRCIVHTHSTFEQVLQMTMHVPAIWFFYYIIHQGRQDPYSLSFIVHHELEEGRSAIRLLRLWGNMDLMPNGRGALRICYRGRKGWGPPFESRQSPEPDTPPKQQTLRLAPQRHFIERSGLSHQNIYNNASFASKKSAERFCMAP
jgi:hypothetical protein